MMSNDDDDDDDGELQAVFAVVDVILQTVAPLQIESEDTKVERGNHQRNSRSKRQKYDHKGALGAIKGDFLNPNSVFDDKDFQAFFRISKARFQRLLEDIGSCGIPFYTDISNGQSSLEAKLLLPLKTLAYGVSCNAFRDYFKMSSSQAREACLQFDVAIKTVYELEYLKQPSAEDLKSLYLLHEKKHRFPGMVGSLDCCHCSWKNCPKAWAGSFKGKKKKPTIVLEAINDYNLFFWHLTFGHPGSLNDISILELGPLTKHLTSKKFKKQERDSACIPFSIGEQQFTQFYCLVDGIYPKSPRFVKTISNPVTQEEKRFAMCQESARKDIERGFGVLQAQWQWIARPIDGHDIKKIGNRIAACFILHNMNVSDRVMGGDVRASYDPKKGIDMEEVFMPENIAQPSDLTQVQGSEVASTPQIGTSEEVAQEKWGALVPQELHMHLELHKALIDHMNNN